jgi:fumarylacetoacetate (FAA) hydrolase
VVGGVARPRRLFLDSSSVRLCTFEADGREAPGRVEGDRVVELDAASLADWLASGGADIAEHELAAVRLRPPVPRPPSVRDFYAFERHVVAARAQRGLEIAPDWYRIPVFYFSNPAAISGPDDEIVFPAESSAWDYELEAAAVVGAGGAIAGFTILNDWSARDLQKMEMVVGLGPAKGKDFATTLGPVLVTPDELGDLGLEMVARVNGEERSRGNLGDMHWTWDDLVAQGARNTRLLPGDVLGSGTVGTGCILEHGDGRWLRAGDAVELEIEGIGLLRNTVA